MADDHFDSAFMRTVSAMDAMYSIISLISSFGSGFTKHFAVSNPSTLDAMFTEIGSCLLNHFSLGVDWPSWTGMRILLWESSRGNHQETHIGLHWHSFSGDVSSCPDGRNVICSCHIDTS